jgi:hypothetical protein
LLLGEERDPVPASELAWPAKGRWRRCGINTIRLVALSALPSSVSACAATTNLLEAPGDATFREANRLTMMAQMIDDPQYDAPAVANGRNRRGSSRETVSQWQVYAPVSQSCVLAVPAVRRPKLDVVFRIMTTKATKK